MVFGHFPMAIIQNDKKKSRGHRACMKIARSSRILGFVRASCAFTANFVDYLRTSRFLSLFLTRYLWVKPAGHSIASIFGSQAFCALLDQLGLMQEKEHFERTDRYAVLADTWCRERGLEGVMRRGVRPNPRKYPGVGECQFLVQSALGNLAIRFIKKDNSHHYLWPTRRSNSNSHRRPGWTRPSAAVFPYIVSRERSHSQRVMRVGRHHAGPTFTVGGGRAA